MLDWFNGRGDSKWAPFCHNNSSKFSHPNKRRVRTDRVFIVRRLSKIGRLSSSLDVTPRLWPSSRWPIWKDSRFLGRHLTHGLFILTRHCRIKINHGSDNWYTDTNVDWFLYINSIGAIRSGCDIYRAVGPINRNRSEEARRAAWVPALSGLIALICTKWSGLWPRRVLC